MFSIVLASSAAFTPAPGVAHGYQSINTSPSFPPQMVSKAFNRFVGNRAIPDYMATTGEQVRSALEQMRPWESEYYATSPAAASATIGLVHGHGIGWNARGERASPASAIPDYARIAASRASIGLAKVYRAALDTPPASATPDYGKIAAAGIALAYGAYTSDSGAMSMLIDGHGLDSLQGVAQQMTEAGKQASHGVINIGAAKPAVPGYAAIAASLAASGHEGFADQF